MREGSYVEADVFGDEWLGRQINENFLADLLALVGSIKSCSENGEFNAAVLNGPTIKKGFGSEKLAKSVGGAEGSGGQGIWVV